MRIDKQIYASPVELAGAAARLVTEASRVAIRARGYFTFVLAGGSTPAATYQHLAATPEGQGPDWSRTHVFFGDERCVPPEDERSNYRLADEVLLSKVPLPAENVYRMRGEIPPPEAARRYQEEIVAFYTARDALPENGPPAFDLVLLGLGPDGHTASLFPGDASLDEVEKWVVSTEHQAPPPPLVSRITLTLPILAAARQVVFLVSGAGKARRLAEVLGEGGEAYPAGRVRASESLVWLLDRAAAQQLE